MKYSRWSVRCLGANFIERTYCSSRLTKQMTTKLEQIHKLTLSSSEIIYGIQPTLSVISAKQRSISEVFIRNDVLDMQPEHLLSKNRWLSTIVNSSTPFFPVNAVSRDFMSALTNGRSNQGVAVLCSPMPVPSLQSLPASKLLHFIGCRYPNTRSSCCGSSSMILLLDQIQDVMNLGNILRSAVFFGVPTVLFSAFFSAAPSPLISKLSAGAMEYLRFFRITHTASMLKRLSAAGFLVVGTAGNQPSHVEIFDHAPPIDLSRIEPPMVGASTSGEMPRPLVLALGSEATGLANEVLASCDLVIRIPGLVDAMSTAPDDSPSPLPTSLNVAAATAILLHKLKDLRAANEC